MDQQHLAIGFGVLSMVTWGVWAALADAATDSLAPETAMIVSYATAVVVAAGYVGIFREGALAFPTGGVLLAAAAGVFAGIGAVAFYAGLNVGRTGIVTTISALYFVVAAVIGVTVMDEPVGLREVAGIALAIGAVVLLAR